MKIARGRCLIAALAVGVLTLFAVVAGAQPAGHVPRVGILQTWPVAVLVDRLEAFKRRMRELGYEEGRNIVFEFRSTEGRTADVHRLAAELVELNVDVIFAPTTVAATAVHARTRTIPIVIAIAADPVGVKLADSLARPGRNVTGMTTNNLEIVPKRFQLLGELIGGRPFRAALLYAPADPSNVLVLRHAQEAARQRGIDLKPIAVDGDAGLRAAFVALRAERTEGLFVAAGAVMDSRARQIAEMAALAKIPAIYGAPEFVEVGGLMSYSSDFADNFARAATYVDRILKGGRPADMPIEQSNKFLLVVNRTAVRSLGLSIQPPLMLQVDRVVD